MIADEGMEQLTGSKPEHRHVVSDVSMAIKKSLLLINNTPGDGVDQIMKSLTYSSRRGTSIEADSSSTDADQEKHPERPSSIGRIAMAKRCTARELTTDCKELSESASPTPAKQRTWEKEMDTSTICTQLVHRKSPDNVGDSEDPFFFGVLRKATRLGSSFRPRLCRGVDVMDSTRFKTKLQFRSKSKHEDTVVAAAATAAAKPVKECKTLSEYFESPAQLKLANDDSEPTISVKEEIVPSDPVPPASAPAPTRRPFGNEALDASYRNTMEVLTKLPTSRGSCRIHTLPVQKGGFAGAQKLIRSDSTRTSPMKPHPSNAIVHHEPCSIHGMESTPLKQRPKSSAKKTPSGTGFEASTVRSSSDPFMQGTHTP